MRKVFSSLCLLFISVGVSSSLWSFAPLDTKTFREAQCSLVPMPQLSTVQHPLRPHHRRTVQPDAHIRASTSTNWSGYSSLTSLHHPLQNSVDNVFGTWTVPTLSQSSKHTYCAIWVGMDGYIGDTVEQIGSEQEWVNGRQINYAWFEMYPGPLYQIVGFPVSIGDKIGGQVQYVRNSNGKAVFQLTIFNYSQFVWWTVPLSYTQSESALRNSANWIVEAPTSVATGKILPLAHFAPIEFANCQTTIEERSGAINNSHWKYDAITMKTAHGTVKAEPSDLSSSGKSFTVTWHHQ